MLFMRIVVAVIAFAGALLASGAAHAQQTSAASSAARDAITAARFSIVVDGYEIASFTKFDSMVDPSTSAPSQAISLTGGHSHSPQLWAWHEAVLMGDIVAARKSCSIVMFDYKGTPIARWELKQAWPVKYTGVTMSNGRGLKTEGVMLLYDGIDLPPER